MTYKCMRILIISNYYPPAELGGWEQLAYDIVVRLQSRGHQLFILTSNYQAKSTPPESNIARVLHLESPDHIHYHLHYTLAAPWRERQNYYYLTKTVSQFQPDIIFVQGMWNLSRIILSHAEQLYPGRVIYYMASYWPTDLDAHTAYWETPTRRLWLRRSKQWVSQLARWTLLPDLLQHQLTFTRVLCVSHFVQRYMVDKVGIPLSQTHVVYNGIAIEEFIPKDPAHSADQPLRLLYAGGLVAQKGVQTAIEAMGYLVNQLGVTNTHLTLIGGGSSAYVQHLSELIRTFHLENFVKFGDRVARNQMPAILRQYDVLLFPSIWAEPLARMVQEAMACGLVVIGTTTGGTPEILQDGENGLTFEANNSQMLAKKIVEIANDPALRQRLSHAARRTVEERFTIDRMVDEIEKHLVQVASL